MDLASMLVSKNSDPRPLKEARAPSVASPKRPLRPAPEGINSEITRSHFLGKQSCYDRVTCLPVRRKAHHDRHHDSDAKSSKASIVPPEECTKFSQTRDLYDCCFFHSIGALEGGNVRSPEGCTPDKWPEDTRTYQRFAERSLAAGAAPEQN